MHNGRIFKEGTPGGDRGRRRGAGHLSRGPSMAEARAMSVARPDARGVGPRRALRPRAGAAGSQPAARARRARRRRPQRHGQVHALQDRDGAGAADQPARSARDGEEIAGLSPHRIARLGVAYVPQGRRCWPSLTVDEHLRLGSGNGAKGEWTLERIYDTFPRLKERRRNGGAQLSGGEQQMLAISRALISQSAASHHGRADRGAGAGHRPAGRADDPRAGARGTTSRSCSSSSSSAWRSISPTAWPSCCTAGSSARCFPAS